MSWKTLALVFATLCTIRRGTRGGFIEGDQSEWFG